MYKVDKNTLRTEYAKVWGNAHMIDYCTNQAAAMFTLPTGEILTVDKQKIETHFCFDDSYDYDGAQSKAHHARTSVDYLREENLKYFNTYIREIEQALASEELLTDRSYLWALSQGYRNAGANLVKLHQVSLYDVLEMNEDIHLCEDAIGATVNIYGIQYRVLTREELTEVLNLYKYARDKHEKKVNSYIKRYGTSKVHSWTYWGEA